MKAFRTYTMIALFLAAIFHVFSHDFAIAIVYLVLMCVVAVIQ